MKMTNQNETLTETDAAFSQGTQCAGVATETYYGHSLTCLMYEHCAHYRLTSEAKERGDELYQGVCLVDWCTIPSITITLAI